MMIKTLQIADKPKLTGVRQLSSAMAFLILAITALALPARAHEVRPAIADVLIEGDTATLTIRLTLESLVAGLDLTELGDTNDSPRAEVYDRLRAMPPAELQSLLEQDWPVIRKGFDIRSGGDPIPPELTGAQIPEPGNLDLPRDSIVTLSLALPPGGAPVTIGWAASYGPLVVRQSGAGDQAYSGYLSAGQSSEPLPRVGTISESWVSVALRYVVIGYVHIVPKGLDHILFVLGLFFFSLHIRPLLMQVTAFTAAHTVSLALATLGYVSVNPAIVEPLIAASIVYVAVENILWQKLSPWRTLVVFGFGLLHGLGFAAVLGEIGLSPGRFITGLISFNVGVEFGQLSVILAAFLLVGLPFGHRPWYRSRIALPVSAAIAVVGGWWAIERVFL